jgi:small neutral amino acid transporter SnatA (MarC family)
MPQKKVAFYCFFHLHRHRPHRQLGPQIVRHLHPDRPTRRRDHDLPDGLAAADFRQRNKDKKETAHPDATANIDDILFYPVAFPMTTGPGTISIILTLSAHPNESTLSEHFFNLAALVIAILGMCILVFICYANTPRLTHRLGPRGEQIVNRLSAFLVFCIGMQIAFSGIKVLFHLTSTP